MAEHLMWDEVEKRLQNGSTVIRRLCRVCKEPVGVKLKAGRPVLVSCGCRPKGCDREMEYSWDDARKMFG